MARVPYLPRNAAGADAQPLYDRLETERKVPTANIFLAMANAPAMLDAFLSYANVLRDSSELSPRLRELAILTVGHVTDCRYEIAHHQSHGLKAGLTPEQLAAVPEFESATVFDETERAVMRLAKESTLSVDVPADVWDPVAELLSNKQLVELDPDHRLVQLGSPHHGTPGHRPGKRIRAGVGFFPQKSAVTSLQHDFPVLGVVQHAGENAAARLHALGEPMSIDTIEVPKPRPTDVLVRVKACRNRAEHGQCDQQLADLVPPPAAAEVSRDLRAGPHRCGRGGRRRRHQRQARRPGLRESAAVLRQLPGVPGGKLSRCRYYTLNGYFSTSREGQRIFDLYPYGGFAEYMTAPQ